jgi:ATP-dependent DNA ligase
MLSNTSEFLGRFRSGPSQRIEKCVWVRPELVARIEYLEWTEGVHLRHAKFAGLRFDKKAPNVIKEHAGET